MTSPLAALEQLAALSEAMRGAAGSGDWETLAEHEAARRALADSLPASLSGSLPAAVQAKARALIEACQRCDADVRPLVDARLNELRVVLRAARAGPQADA
ncbi:flagellar protein FliT [Accumulibacter sp.]|uniref:flagellar protein FliT n=1 Tax=Accumulibacter sp. TaxID=2053492 RepID=UPI001A401BDB|nr:flagellar protein FliT [Accumulibacter sp.]MBL8373702.1 flagellar protein FliT [Accumulibacter sp.]